MDDMAATMALHQLSLYLSRYYGKKVIILLDEYDAPMQEAYIHGYWDELVSFKGETLESAVESALKQIEEKKGERKKEERIKCKHKSFTLCVCASNENASIFA